MINYWWVNQNQTFDQEVSGGYLWSPKKKANGHRNPFYEFMRAAKPGDIVFCFSDTRIKAIGRISSTSYGFPKPEEFGKVGSNWSDFGWRVDVKYSTLKQTPRPSEHMGAIKKFLPSIYSPLQANGRGNQSVYLTTVSPGLAGILFSLVGQEADNFLKPEFVVKDPVAEFLELEVEGITLLEDRMVKSLTVSLDETERESVIMARRGQGKFRANLARVERQCRVTEVLNPQHLVASHIKPWRYCDDSSERLSENNGLMLTPSIDQLFDRGFISFEDTGDLIISPIADTKALKSMGVEEGRFLQKNFNGDQRHFLDYHRADVFLMPLS